MEEEKNKKQTKKEECERKPEEHKISYHNWLAVRFHTIQQRIWICNIFLYLKMYSLKLHWHYIINSLVVHSRSKINEAIEYYN